MRSILKLCLILLMLAAQACSRPPDFHPPDRPPTFEGVITAIKPHDVSTGVIEMTQPG